MKSIFTTAFILFSLVCFSQEKLNGGVIYKILKQNSKSIHVGDVVFLHIIGMKENDSIILDSHINPKKPYQFEVQKPTRGNYDLMAWLPLLRKGDSVMFEMPSDSLFLNDEIRPLFIKKHSKLKIIIAIINVMTKEESEQIELKEAKAQALKEDLIIQEYIKENKIDNIHKTESGLYYTIVKKGKGENIKDGRTATVNYTGYLIDGKMFDSNSVSSFQHVEPFIFTVGKNQVIKGWEEGIKLLNKGAKAKFILPSNLGYGTQKAYSIPENSILIFDVELKRIK